MDTDEHRSGDDLNGGRRPPINVSRFDQIISRKDAKGQRIVEKYLKKSLSYAEYVKLIDDLLLEGKTTGTNQSYAMFNYGKLNRQRMHRLEKTVTLEPETVFSMRSLDVKWIWLVITEGWCGDAAQNIPIIEKIATENPGIRTRYILRDENLELMDQYLTNGARSIPKLIALDANTLEVLGTWGARPKAAQELFYQLKEQGIEKPQIMERLQRWYNDDHGRSIQRESSGSWLRPGARTLLSASPVPPAKDDAGSDVCLGHPKGPRRRFFRTQKTRPCGQECPRSPLEARMMWPHLMQLG